MFVLITNHFWSDLNYYNLKENFKLEIKQMFNLGFCKIRNTRKLHIPMFQN